MTLEEPQQDKALNSENSPTRLLYIDCNVNKQRTHPLTYFGGWRTSTCFGDISYFDGLKRCRIEVEPVSYWKTVS